MVSDCGEFWVEKYHCPEISDFGRQVANLLDELFYGFHHISREATHKRVDWKSDRWIEIVLPGILCTYDSGGLTRLVLLAHKYCIRVEVSGASVHYLKLSFSPRKREGATYERHPTIEQAIAYFGVPYYRTGVSDG